MSDPTPDRERDRKEIFAHIDRIFHAFAARDNTALSRTHLPDFRGFTVRSRSVIRNREQYLEQMNRILESQPVTSCAILESDILFHESTAVVSYIAALTGRIQNGASATTKLRVMDVYSRTPEGWNLAAASVSLHPDEIDRHLSVVAASAPKQS